MKNKTKNGNATHVGIHHACIWPLLTFNVDIHLAVSDVNRLRARWCIRGLSVWVLIGMSLPVPFGRHL